MTRIEKIRKQMEGKGAQGLLITSPLNRRYATGFNSSAGIVVITMEKAFYITDSRYIEAATKNTDPAFKVLQLGESYIKDLANLVNELGIKKLGFENRAMSVFEFEGYKNGVPAEFIPFDLGVERVRQNKEPEELEFMKKAQAITEKAFNVAVSQIKVGVTEREIATVIMHEMNKNGASGLAFSCIVVSGANSSLPHGVPGDKKIEAGDFITIDIGAAYNGYASDMTRTVAVDHVTDEMKKVYDTVLKAQLAALDFAQVGKRGKDIDAAARDIITQAGYGENFQHGLGHCVGLNVHEDPRASKTDESLMEVGHVLTIEPGIYLAGKFGVRIEDMLYFGPNGKENLTHVPKELLIIK